MAGDVPPASVSADMDRIFKPLTDRAVVVSPSDGGPPQHGGRRGKRNWRGVTLVAPALVLLAGGALAVGYVQHGVPPSASTGPATVARAPVRTEARAPETAVVPAVPTEGAVVAPQPETDRAESPATRPTIPASRETQAAAASVAMPARPSRAMGEGGDRAARAETGDTVRPGQCAPGSLDDQCIYQDVLDADARLRRAYQRARQSGVPYGQLSAINRQWTRARDAAQDDPDGTIRRYDRLTDMLDRARREGFE